MAKTRKFIIQPSDELMNKFPKEVRELIQKGRQQKFVTHQEIEGALPNFEEDMDLMEELMEIFENLGIEIVDQKNAFEWRKQKEVVGTKAEEKKKKKEKITDLAEIAGDSIRMYLSEIGRVPLL